MAVLNSPFSRERYWPTPLSPSLPFSRHYRLEISTWQSRRLQCFFRLWHESTSNCICLVVHRGNSGWKTFCVVSPLPCVRGPFSFCKWKRPFICIPFAHWIGFVEHVCEPKLQILPRQYIALESKLPSDAQRTEASIYKALTVLTWPTFKCFMADNSLDNIHISTEGYNTTLWWFPCNTTLTALEFNIL